MFFFKDSTDVSVKFSHILYVRCFHRRVKHVGGCGEGFAWMCCSKGGVEVASGMRRVAVNALADDGSASVTAVHGGSHPL